MYFRLINKFEGWVSSEFYGNVQDSLRGGCSLLRPSDAKSRLTADCDRNLDVIKVLLCL